MNSGGERVVTVGHLTSETEVMLGLEPTPGQRVGVQVVQVFLGRLGGLQPSLDAVQPGLENHGEGEVGIA